MAADDLEFEAPFGLVGSVLPYALVGAAPEVNGAVQNGAVQNGARH